MNTTDSQWLSCQFSVKEYIFQGFLHLFEAAAEQFQICYELRDRKLYS